MTPTLLATALIFAPQAPQHELRTLRNLHPDSDTEACTVPLHVAPFSALVRTGRFRQHRLLRNESDSYYRDALSEPSDQDGSRSKITCNAAQSPSNSCTRAQEETAGCPKKQANKRARVNRQDRRARNHLRRTEHYDQPNGLSEGETYRRTRCRLFHRKTRHAQPATD